MRWMDEYARQVTAGLEIDSGVDPISHCGLGLAGEAGEVADIIKKSQYKGRTLDVPHLKEELGDALWYLTAIASRFGWSLRDLADDNVSKLENRRGVPYSTFQMLAAE